MDSTTATSFQLYNDSTITGINEVSNSTEPFLNSTTVLPGPYFAWDDATWVLICTYIIFTMQSGFGLLESGSVSGKNAVNILYKNAADVVFGGTIYWLIGFGLSYGNEPQANVFCGFGYWAVNITDPSQMGDIFVRFIFQLSFANSCVTIVSGAMAERVKLSSYLIFATFNTLVYCFPAHWVWDERGFLYKLGVVDIAGSGVVHLTGGVAAFVSCIMLGPRKGRYENGSTPPQVGNATNLVLGTMLLWWGWLGFNCGSTFGIQGGLWVSAGTAAVNTLVGSMGGGIVGVFYSLATKKGMYSVTDLCNCLLGGLVGITAPCAIIQPWEAFIIGIIGALVCMAGVALMDRCHIDDPVGAISVHGFCGIWSLIAVGLFTRNDTISGFNRDQLGLFHGGGFYLLGVELLLAVTLIVWAGLMTFIITGLLKKSPLKLRMAEQEEIVGADEWEHGIIHPKLTCNHPLNTEQGDDTFLITDELDERDDSVNCSEDRVTQSGKNVASTGFKFRKTKAKINKGFQNDVITEKKEVPLSHDLENKM